MKEAENHRKGDRSPTRRRSPGERLLYAAGPFSQSRVWELAGQIVTCLREHGVQADLADGVRKAWLEMGQNLVQHDEASQQRGNPSVEVRTEPGSLVISTRNRISVESALALRRIVSRLNSLDEDGLAEVYDRQLRSSYEDRSEPLFLGLIRIVRLSRSRLDINIRRIDRLTARIKIEVRFS